MWGIVSVRTARKGRRPFCVCSWPVAMSPGSLPTSCIPKSKLLIFSSQHKPQLSPLCAPPGGKTEGSAKGVCVGGGS